MVHDLFFFVRIKGKFLLVNLATMNINCGFDQKIDFFFKIFLNEMMVNELFAVSGPVLALFLTSSSILRKPKIQFFRTENCEKFCQKSFQNSCQKRCQIFGKNLSNIW